MTDVAALERVLWSMMQGFETLALAQYAAHAPALATDEKRALVAQLAAAAPSDAALRATPLSAPVADLLVVAEGADVAATLLVQGLLLEQLGRVIYERAHEVEGVSAQGRAIAASGKAAAEQALDAVPGLVERDVGRGDKLFDAFVKATAPVLSRLDALGEAVDAVFAEPFDIRFADLMGDVTAEVLPVCTALGVERRKLIIHFTGALMKSA